jgi:26S proteasome regulatory subunit N3
MNTFHQRIDFCLNLHNESVKALRYPDGAHKKALEEAAELLKQSAEIVHDLEDDDMSE